MSVKVEIYTKGYCAYCKRAKELLRIKGVNYIEYDITDDQLKAEEMRQRGRMNTVPGIFVEGTPIGGCRELFELDERGVLDPMLQPIKAFDESSL